MNVRGRGVDTDGFKVDSNLGSTQQTTVQLIEVRMYESNVYSPAKAMASKSHQSIFTDYTLSVETYNLM